MPSTDIEVETLIERLEIPWDIAFTGDGTIFLTERTGSVLRFDSGAVSEIIRPRDVIDAESMPPGSDKQSWLMEGGEGGTLGVDVHPAYPDEPYIYIYYTATTALGKENRVARFDVDARAPGSTAETLVDSIPAGDRHNGGRIRFGPDDNLWICTGDSGDGRLARDLSSLAGKILRIEPDGNPPSSNPDLNGDPRIFTYGHRNPQGIDWLPSGVALISEHGPSGRDEVNVLLPGADYGWDTVRGGTDDEDWGSYTDFTGVVPPVVNTGPDRTWAPAGGTVYTGDELPTWKNRFLVAGLASESIHIVSLTPSSDRLPPLEDSAYRYDADWLDSAYTATAYPVLENDLGRIRHVTQSPAGTIYALTSNRDGRASGEFPREKDDVLVTLTPVSPSPP